MTSRDFLESSHCLMSTPERASMRTLGCRGSQYALSFVAPISGMRMLLRLQARCCPYPQAHVSFYTYFLEATFDVALWIGIPVSMQRVHNHTISSNFDNALAYTRWWDMW